MDGRTRNLHLDKSKLGYLLIGIPVCFLLLWLIAVPLLMVFVTSFQVADPATGATSFGLQSWVTLGSKEALEAIGNSLLLALLVSLFSVVIALPVAFILAKTKLRKLWWLDIVFMIPFMIPPYINSMGWINFMGENGILWRLSDFFHPLCESFFSIWGMAFVMSLHTAPFLMTLMKNALLALPASLDDSSYIFSKSRIRRVLSIYGPILLPNFAIGAFLVFVKALAEYGTPSTFQVFTNLEVFSTLITNRIQVMPISFGEASALATLLLSICMVLYALELTITSRRAYALNGTPAKKAKGGTLSLIIGSLVLLVLFFFSVFIPFYSIFTYSITEIPYLGLTRDNISFENYRLAFSDETGFGNGWQAIANTFEVGLLSGVIILVCGLCFGVYVRRYRKKRIGRVVEFLDMLPQMIPNIVTGIGFIMLYNSISKAIPIYGTEWVLIIAYIIIFLPNMFSYIKNSLMQMPESLLEAGDIYSHSRANVDLEIVMPYAYKGAFYGFIMVLIISMRELVTAKLLLPGYFYTISVFIDKQYSQGNQGAAMALAVVSIMITLVILIPLEFISYRAKKGDNR